MSDRFILPAGKAAVATLVATHGTTPKDPGARMWVGGDGRIIGSVTIGGCVDARVIEESARVVLTGVPKLIDMSLGDEDAWAMGMTCGGRVEVLIEPVDPTRLDDPVSGALRHAERAVAAGGRAVVVVPLTTSSDRLVVREGAAPVGSLGSLALDAAAAAVATEVFATGVSGVRMVTVDGVEHRLYLELHAPPLSLVVIGATHVAMPLVALAHELGLRTTIVDGRDRFATRERFPLVDDIRIGIPSEMVEQLTLGPETLVVLLAHDYKYDLPVLRTVLATDTAYVGLLGSQKRGKALLDFLAEEGVPPDQLARVRVPVGLDIGARSASEIALSVLAEALAVRRGRPGGPMRDRQRVTVP